MAKQKLTQLKKIILFAYLVIFPFGQIPSFLATLVFHKSFGFQLMDVLVFLYVAVAFINSKDLLIILTKTQLPKIFSVLLLSVLGGFVILGAIDINAIFYLLRLIFYILFGFVLFIDKPLTKTEATNSLLGIGMVVAVIGLIQYTFFPDLRMLKAFGWDDHLFRLAFPFIDPAFTGIILVLSILFLLFKVNLFRGRKIAVLLVLFTALLLTYSRASYLSLVVSIFCFGIIKSSKRKIILLFVSLFLVVLFALPRPGGEGVKLERTFSLMLKIQNYGETFDLWKKSPLVGVGYNNLCLVKLSSLATQTEIYSHSCSGSDSSILLILATTGVFGLMIFAALIFNFLKKENNLFLYLIFAALFVHSQFTNTLFYPWVMGWLAILMGSSLFKEKK